MVWTGEPSAVSQNTLDITWLCFVLINLLAGSVRRRWTVSHLMPLPSGVRGLLRSRVGWLGALDVALVTLGQLVQPIEYQRRC